MCLTMASSSSKRARLDLVLAGGESNSGPSVSAGNQHCFYPGCARPLLNSESERKFCGEMHRNIHMSNLAMTRSCKGQETIVTSSISAADDMVSDSNKPKCMLPVCRKKALWDDCTSRYFDFCGKKHKLKMVEELTKVWSREDRLCQVEDCYQHVYVEEDGTRYDFCGFKHATFAAARKGATTELSEKRRSIIGPRETVCTTSSQAEASRKECQSIESLVDSEVGYHEKISDSELLRLLKGEANEEGSPRVQQGINIYDFHPWELVYKFGGGRPRYFLHSATQQRDQKGQSQIKRKTKDGFSWKQSGPLHSSESKDMETRYLKYMLEETTDIYGHLLHVQEYKKFNQAGANSQKSRKKKGPKCRWKLHEISLRDSGYSETKIVWIIFQDPQGEPVWPPCRQPAESSVPAVILNPSQVQDLITLDAESDIGRSEPQFDTTVSAMQLDFRSTEFICGLDAPGWGHYIEWLDLSETQMELDSGTAEDFQSQDDIERLWKYPFQLQDSGSDYTSYLLGK